MSQGFRFRYDEMRENDPGRNNPNTNEDLPADTFYPSYGQVRNVCFILLDGSRVFLNYAYLVAGEYAPESNTIVLGFTTHTVTLKGFRLEDLYEQLMQQLNKLIACVDDRYNDVQDAHAPIVNMILITNN